MLDLCLGAYLCYICASSSKYLLSLLLLKPLSLWGLFLLMISWSLLVPNSFSSEAVILRECHTGSFQWLAEWFAKTN